jgi:hypothetical protein
MSSIFDLQRWGVADIRERMRIIVFAHLHIPASMYAMCACVDAYPLLVASLAFLIKGLTPSEATRTELVA